MTMTFDELRRRGELEPGEKVRIAGTNYDVSRVRLRTLQDLVNGMYYAHREGYYLHPGGIWRTATSDPSYRGVPTRRRYPAYFESLEELLENLYVAELQAS